MWKEFGPIITEVSRGKERIRFPEGRHKLPVIYRFRLGNETYIGEAENFHQRMQCYRTPARNLKNGASTNYHRNRDIMAAARNGEAFIDIWEGGELLTDKMQRRAVEADLVRAECPTLNK